MNTAKIIVILLSSWLLWNCGSDEAKDAATITAQTSTEPGSEITLPAPVEDQQGKVDLQSTVAVGEIQEACQLVPEEWVKAKIPGFQSADFKRISRTSPDGNASACQCQLDGEKTAFVIGYKKSAGNLQFLQDLITNGMKKQDDFNVPPYNEVQGLGQKAAFSKYNGNLAWVTDEGLYIYMFLFPQSPEMMKDHFNILYSVAPDINTVVKKYVGKS